MWLVWLLACTTAEKSDSEETDAVGSDTQVSDTDGTDTELGDANAIALSGSVTWTLEFDEDAEATGAFDCSYTREVTAEGVLDQEYVCPECTHIAVGTGVLDALDCIEQISSVTDLENTEVWGFSDTTFYRTSREQYPLSELAEVSGVAEGTDIALSWESEYELTDGGNMVLTATGSFSYETSVVRDDPWPERTEDYACGWPRQPIEGERSYPLTEGEVVPNVMLEDQCGEDVALWDLAGRWIVLDSTQSDCGPCQSMARGAEDFVADMEAQGYDVMVVSLLGNGLADPFGTPDEETHQEWVEAFELTDPVLADRGYAYALFPEYLETLGEDFGYPAWVVIDPEMQLVTGNVGFSSWSTVEDLIIAAAEE